MKVAVTSSNSLIGQIVTEILIARNIYVISIGRRHDSRAHTKIHWDLRKDLELPDDVDYVFYLTFDHSSIKKWSRYRENNFVKLEAMLENELIRKRIVIPLSESGRKTVKSRYGQIKYGQKLLAEKYGCRTINIGWTLSRNNGGEEIQRTIKLLRALRLNFIPVAQKMALGITRYEDLDRAINEIIHGKHHAIAISPEKTNLKQLIYGETELIPLNLGPLTKLSLSMAVSLYPVLPKKWVRVFDSARSVAL